MGILITCESCGKSCGDDVFCSTCADGEEDVDVGHDVTDLAAAIRRGDTSEAEVILDRIGGQIDGWSDMISLGRYSPRARIA